MESKAGFFSWLICSMVQHPTKNALCAWWPPGLTPLSLDTAPRDGACASTEGLERGHKRGGDGKTPLDMKRNVNLFMNTVYIYICIYVYMYICIYVYVMYIYIYVYIYICCFCCIFCFLFIDIYLYICDYQCLSIHCPVECVSVWVSLSIQHLVLKAHAIMHLSIKSMDYSGSGYRW